METITKVQRLATSITAQINSIDLFIDYEQVDGQAPAQIVVKSNYQEAASGERPFGYLTVVRDDKGGKNIQINDVKDLSVVAALLADIDVAMDAIVNESADLKTLGSSEDIINAASAEG